MNSFISLLEQDTDYLRQLVARARALKGGAAADAIRGKILGLLFFNPSLRTRVSFESAMARFGGHAIVLSPGKDTWNLEYREVVMDRDSAEHIEEAVKVLSRYCDALGVRTFASLSDAAEDARDEVIRAFAENTTVPLINMESAMDHPCQGLADLMTMKEKLNETEGKTFCLTWAPHMKALPLAVGHCAITAAAHAGMNIVIARPTGHDLDESITDRVTEICSANNASFDVTTDQKDACACANIIYVKSWGSRNFYGHAVAQAKAFKEFAHWTVTKNHLTRPDQLVMHCLPVRRGIVMTADLLRSPNSIVIDQAENRMWAQAAILESLWN
jgi:N-acetylornithine carbamoyltransferase